MRRHFFRNSLTWSFMVFFVGRDLGEWGAHRKIGSGKTRVMIWAESTYAYRSV